MYSTLHSTHRHRDYCRIVLMHWPFNLSQIHYQLMSNEYRRFHRFDFFLTVCGFFFCLLFCVNIFMSAHLVVTAQWLRMQESVRSRDNSQCFFFHQFGFWFFVDFFFCFRCDEYISSGGCVFSILN